MSVSVPAGRLGPVLAVLLSVAACSSVGLGGLTTIGEGPYEDGSGKVATESRTVEAFHAISASQGVTVLLTAGPSTAVSVTADDNLLPHVITDLRNGTLVVGVEGSIRTRNEIKVSVTATSIDAIAASSGATVDGRDLAGNLKVSANSGATVRGGGKLDALELSVDAGATADLRNAETRSARVRLTTGSTAYVNARESVGGSCGMGSTLHVRGGGSLDVSNDESSTVERD